MVTNHGRCASLRKSDMDIVPPPPRRFQRIFQLSVLMFMSACAAEVGGVAVTHKAVSIAEFAVPFEEVRWIGWSPEATQTAAYWSISSGSPDEPDSTTLELHLLEVDGDGMTDCTVYGEAEAGFGTRVVANAFWVNSGELLVETPSGITSHDGRCRGEFAPIQEFTSKSPVNLLAADLHGQSLLLTIDNSLAIFDRRSRHLFETGILYALEVTSWAWQSDGRAIAIASAESFQDWSEQVVYLVDLRSETRQEVYRYRPDDALGQPKNLDWLSDDKLLVKRTSDGPKVLGAAGETIAYDLWQVVGEEKDHLVAVSWNSADSAFLYTSSMDGWAGLLSFAPAVSGEKIPFWCSPIAMPGFCVRPISGEGIPPSWRVYGFDREADGGSMGIPEQLVETEVEPRPMVAERANLLIVRRNPNQLLAVDTRSGNPELTSSVPEGILQIVDVSNDGQFVTVVTAQEEAELRIVRLE